MSAQTIKDVILDLVQADPVVSADILTQKVCKASGRELTKNYVQVILSQARKQEDPRVAKRPFGADLRAIKKAARAAALEAAGTTPRKTRQPDKAVTLPPARSRSRNYVNNQIDTAPLPVPAPRRPRQTVMRPARQTQTLLQIEDVPYVPPVRGPLYNLQSMPKQAGDPDLARKVKAYAEEHDISSWGELGKVFALSRGEIGVLLRPVTTFVPQPLE